MTLRDPFAWLMGSAVPTLATMRWSRATLRSAFPGLRRAGRVRPALGAVLSVLGLAGCHQEPVVDHEWEAAMPDVTFSQHVAPLLFQNCAPCHRPGQSAPFSLLTYADARKHASEIVTATQKRYMPPWLPEPGYGDFLDERHLRPGQIELLRRWLMGGLKEGPPSALPPQPQFPGDWQLGPPDLIVRMPAPYTLAAEGRDLYRNFVIPAPVNQKRFVRALEFHPGTKSVHHVRILLDPTRQSRRLDGQQAEVGFAGMTVPARFPPGHMLTWSPGRAPRKEPEGLGWVLEAGTDIVLQIHMQRTGKPEPIQPELGLYFTEQPPSRTPGRLGMLSELIDIPAGQPDYLVERSFELPADVDVLAVLPHLHYLGRRLEGFATLPDGSKQWLLFIKDWDFNWQSEYYYRRPVFLPKGSVISMRLTYDNSAQNPRNPNLPPRRVVFGPQSTDEMGELWLQFLPRRPEDLPTVLQAHRMAGFRETAAYFERQVSLNPNDPHAHFGLGKVLGPLGHIEQAVEEFAAAVRLKPDFGEAHYYLGLSLHDTSRLEEARGEFEAALRLNPQDYKAHDGLGLVALRLRDLAQARSHFEAALRLNPDDPVARTRLESLSKSGPKTDKPE
jgi:tetratricopeptide (TPR) repeat protein/mono/diheme cytochrome c family protein